MRVQRLCTGGHDRRASIRGVTPTVYALRSFPGEVQERFLVVSACSQKSMHLQPTYREISFLCFEPIFCLAWQLAKTFHPADGVCSSRFLLLLCGTLMGQGFHTNFLGSSGVRELCRLAYLQRNQGNHERDQRLLARDSRGNRLGLSGGQP